MMITNPGSIAGAAITAVGSLIKQAMAPKPAPVAPPQFIDARGGDVMIRAGDGNAWGNGGNITIGPGTSIQPGHGGQIAGKP